MEKPYAGRAILNDTFDGMEIIIPAQRYWFAVAFLAFWLCGWVFGEVMAAGTLLSGGAPGGVNIFLFVWLGAWTIGGFFALSMFWWMIRGREVITIGQGQLTLEKRGLLFYRPKTYDLNEVKNVRISPAESAMYGGRNIHLMGYFNTGIIRFDYGLKTIHIANGIDEAEAKFILERLKSKRLITDKNF